MKNILTYGESEDGSFVHISEVANGIACKCVCTNCKNPLIAKNNLKNIKEAHFAHASGNECVNAFETALHRLSKEVFAEEKKIYLPNYFIDYDKDNSKKLMKKGELFQFDEIHLEKRVSKNNEYFIPDAIALKNEKEIYIEFAFSHFVQFEKRNKIINKGISCIEINISGLSLNKDDIKHVLLSENNSKYWVFNTKHHIYQIEFLKALELKEKQRIEEENIKFDKANLALEEIKKNTNLQVFKIINGKATKCPKMWSTINKYPWYNGAPISYILEKSNWNGIIYNEYTYDAHIYVENNRIDIYPFFKTEYMSEQNRDWIERTILSEIKKIQKMMKDDSNICSQCRNMEHNIITREYEYVGCNYLSKKL